MRFLTFLFCLLSATAFSQGRKFYFNVSTGADTYSSTQAQSPSTPWKTIDKLNLLFSSQVRDATSTTGAFINLGAKDTIFLQSGQIFYGAVVPKRSGNSTGNIVITTYPVGSTVKATVSSLITLDTWDAPSGNVYTTTNPYTVQSSPNLVLINGTSQPKSRFPNFSTTYGGYAKISSVGGSGSSYVLGSTDFHTQNTNNINFAPTGTGAITNSAASVLYRSSQFTLEKAPLTAQSSTTTSTSLTTSQRGEDAHTSWGEIVVNHPKACDLQGEWAYTTDNKLHVYSSSAITNFKVEIPSKDDVFSIGNYSYITIDNLILNGANNSGVKVSGGANIVVKNNIISNTGVNGIVTSGASGMIIDNNIITDIIDQGIRYKGSSYGTVTNNKVTRVGMDLASYVNYTYGLADGISFDGSSNVIAKYNDVTEIGFNGITMSSESNQHIDSNFVSMTNKFIEDGGPLYSADGKGNNRTNRSFIGNIVDGVYNTGWWGTDKTSSGQWVGGIYLDNYTNHTTVQGNTLIGMPIGLYLHHAYNITARDNNLFGVNSRQIELANSPDSFVTGLNFKHNYYLSTGTGGVKGIYYLETGLTSDQWMKDHYGSFDSSKFYNPLGSKPEYQYFDQNVNSSRFNYTALSQWKSQYPPWEAHSSETPPVTTYTAPNNTSSSAFFIKYNKTKVRTRFNLGGKKWKDMDGNIYDDSVTLSPYESKMFMYFGTTSGGGTGTNTKPVIDMIAPLNGANYSAPATIAFSTMVTDDGAITSVDFYNGTTKIGTSASTGNPYTFNWSGIGAGTLNLTAIVTDAGGLKDTSQQVIVTVSQPTSPNIKPTVTLTSPSNNASYLEGDSITLTATAADQDGTITSVKFYANNVLLFTEGTSPYTRKWFNVPANSYNIKAVAFDNSQDSTISNISVVNVSGVSLSTDLLSPNTGDVFISPASISLSANALAGTSGGQIQKVEFFNSGVSIGVSTSTTNPYSFTWNNVAVGNYSLTVKATNANGTTVESPAANIGVIAPSGGLDPDTKYYIRVKKFYKKIN